jgi:hypothetical protein
MTRPFYIVFTIYFSLLLLALANNSVAQKTIEFSFDDFEEVIELKGEQVKLKAPLKNPYEILLVDSLLFVKNLNTSPVIDVFNLHTLEKVVTFCSMGKGPGELVSPFCIQYIKDKNEILVQDAIGKKLVYFNIDYILNDAERKDSRTVQLDRSILVRKIVEIKGGNFFCDLIGHPDGYMNCMADKNGKRLKFLEKYPQIDVSFNSNTGSNLFPTNIASSKTQDIVVLSYRNSNKIQIFDDKGVLQTNLLGPVYKELILSSSKDGPIPSLNNKECYNIPCIGPNSFMVPYSGKYYEYSFTPANQVLSFSRTGEPLKKYITTPSCTEIAVDWDKRLLYSINLDLEPTLYKFKF